MTDEATQAAELEPAALSAADEQGLLLVGQAEDLRVVDQDTYNRAGAMLVAVKAYLEEVERLTKPVVRAAHGAWQAALEQQRGLMSHALEAEKILKGAIGDYEKAQETARREAERAAAEQRQRAEAEARRVADEQAARARREAEERREAEARQARESGDAAKAERIAAAPVVVPPPPAPVQSPMLFTPPPPPKPVAPPGVSVRDVWKFEVVNAAEVPREYLSVDETKIRKVVDALKGQTKIPGVRVYPDKEVAGSAKRGGRR